MDMRNLKTYRMFESVTELTQEQVQWLNKCARGTWSLNPQTGLVDVKGRFTCYNQGLTDLKGVKFGVVGGDFNCNNNALTSLVGAPQSVGRDFRCTDNQLTSLEGAPQLVGRDFFCYSNQLNSLEGAPQEVDWNFYCHANQLTSLEGAPQRVGVSFYCDHNALTSLVGAPQRVFNDFSCSNNALTSLEGAPLKVGGGLYCHYNPVSRNTLKTIFDKMQKGTSYLAAVESLWSEIPQDDQVLLYADDFKWVTPEQSRGIVALRAYQALRGML